MADGCCSSCSTDLGGAGGPRRRVLTIVLLINAVMFAAELGAGLWAHSSALQADSIDMLVDAIGFAASLFALNRTAQARARAGFLNASLELVLGAGILAQLGHQVVSGAAPLGEFMIGVGAAALVANVTSGVLLMRFRDDDINMRAVWLCTRNDAIGNAATLVAGAAVMAWGLPWPDWLVGALIAGLFVRTSVGVMREAWSGMRSVPSSG